MSHNGGSARHDDIDGKGDRAARVLVSSLRKTNDDTPAANFCEIAAQGVGIGGEPSGD